MPESDDAEAPEQQEVVPLERVKRIVETVYGQRQDKEHNPHGEHAHDVWQVRADACMLLVGLKRYRLRLYGLDHAGVIITARVWCVL